MHHFTPFASGLTWARWSHVNQYNTLLNMLRKLARSIHIHKLLGWSVILVVSICHRVFPPSSCVGVSCLLLFQILGHPERCRRSLTLTLIGFPDPLQEVKFEETMLNITFNITILKEDQTKNQKWLQPQRFINLHSSTRNFHSPPRAVWLAIWVWSAWPEEAARGSTQLNFGNT